jgi:hypothetical protein
MRGCNNSKLGRPFASSATISPSTSADVEPSDLVAPPRCEPDATGVDGRDGADAVPLHLERPVLVVAGQLAVGGEHR